jgi:hypothetical protein
MSVDSDTERKNSQQDEESKSHPEVSQRDSLPLKRRAKGLKKGRIQKFSSDVNLS